MNRHFGIQKHSTLLIFLFASGLCAAGEGLITDRTVESVTGRITGRVIDSGSGRPLPGANVQILETFYGAAADGEGRFAIGNIPVGTYRLRATMMGYRPSVTDAVRVLQGGETHLTFKLVQTVVTFDPIVVVAGKMEQRLAETSASLSVITAKQIERRNPMNLVEAMETAPGVHFIGNQINIRGSTGYTFGAGNKVLLLLDGVPIHASDTGQFNWELLPPLEIKQIEILKGGGSSLWGASALGGVVNIITREPDPSGRFLFSMSVGRYDRPFYEAWTWTDPDRLHNHRTEFSYSRQVGPMGFRISAGRVVTTGYTECGDMRKHNLTGKIDLRLSNSLRWTTYGAFSQINRGFFIQWKGPNDPYEVDPSNLENRARTNQLAFYSRMRWNPSPHLSVHGRFSLVRTLMGNQFGSDAGFNPAYGQGAELQLLWKPGSEHTVTCGIQGQFDTGSTAYFGDHRGYAVGPYLQDEWQFLPGMRLTAGFRYDRYQLVEGRAEDLFSPRIGWNWQLSEDTIFRASAGSGFRAATILERFLELTVMNFKIKKNEALKPERSWAYDIGVRHRFTDDWTFDFSIFNNEYRELIEAHLDLIRGQIQFRNIPRARIRGLEMTTQASGSFFLRGLHLVPGLKISLTLLDHQDLRWEEPLVYRPKQLFTLESSLRIGNVLIEADFRYAARIDAVKIYPINDRVPMKLLNARVSLDIRNLTLQIGARNLLQYNYAPMESNLLPMRNFFIGLQGVI